MTKNEQIKKTFSLAKASLENAQNLFAELASLLEVKPEVEDYDLRISKKMAERMEDITRREARRKSRAEKEANKK